MTVGTTGNKFAYAGDGTTKLFAFPRPFANASDLRVILVDASGSEAVQTAPSDYSVESGNVAMVIAPAVGETLIITRRTEQTQETDYITGGAFSADGHEAALDRLTLIVQDLQEQLDRSVQAPESETSAMPPLPAAAARASKVLGFDAQGATNLLAPDFGDAVGIEDNATATRMRLNDGDVKWVGNTGMSRDVGDSFLRMGGGSVSNAGGNWVLYGENHALAGDSALLTGNSEVYRYSTAIDVHQFKGTTGATIDLINGQNDAVAGPDLRMFRTSSSPESNDVLGIIRLFGRNSAQESIQYASINAQISDATDGSEAGRLNVNTYVNGAQVFQASFGNGLVLGSPAGGFKGTGTINALALYDNNVPVPDVVQDAIARRDGTIDLDAWHARVPNIELEEIRETVPVEIEVDEDVERFEELDGKAVRRIERQKVKRPKVEILPAVDEDGRQIVETVALESGETFERPVMIGKRVLEDRIVQEAQTIERQHTGALMLQAMMDEGFEPWNMASVVEWWQRRNTLPGMPVLDGPEGHADTWEHNKYSVGELVTRKWIAMEIMMACLVELGETVKALEARVEAMDRA